VNRLRQLRDAGVSIWLDDLSRDLIEDGSLARLVDDWSVTGATSNTSIFAYGRFQQRFTGRRWRDLQATGARAQRPLWASTATKNPVWSDVLYVEALAAPDVVITMPEQTLRAFADHGVAPAPGMRTTMCSPALPPQASTSTR
jgi:transaldolase